MAMKVLYTILDGEVLAENRNGVRKVYIPDALGNTVALMDNTGTLTDTFDYFPSGTVAARTGTTPTPFQWNGGSGYFTDSSTRKYVRARNYFNNLGRWGSQDPIGFNGGDFNLYRYVGNRLVTATDPSGLAKLTEIEKDHWVEGDTPKQGKNYKSRNCGGGFWAKWAIQPTGAIKCSPNKFGQIPGFIVQIVTIDKNSIFNCKGDDFSCKCLKYMELMSITLDSSGKAIHPAQDYFVHLPNGGNPIPTYGEYQISGEAKFFCTSTIGDVRKQGFKNNKPGDFDCKTSPCACMSGKFPYKVITSPDDIPSWWDSPDDDGKIATHTGYAKWDSTCDKDFSHTKVTPPDKLQGSLCKDNWSWGCG